jgi:tRNA A-37 threonylcarbamoyl transferase component Bud32
MAYEPAAGAEAKCPACGGAGSSKTLRVPPPPVLAENEPTVNISPAAAKSAPAGASGRGVSPLPPSGAGASPPRDPYAGKIIGGFRLIERLGRGGMSSVYKAEQVSLGRLVAVKIPHREFTLDARHLARFEQEARTLARLAHPNIVQIYDTGRDRDLFYIAMEYVEGTTLGRRVEKEGALSPAAAVPLLKECCAALGRAHREKIVHRDVKPENILLTSDGHVKVSDFGLAKILESDSSLSRTGTILGTPLYMSPEQADGKPLDGRSDLYSLGATFYQVFTGRPPFEGATPVSIALKHVREKPRPADEVNASVPAGIARILDRMMAKRPESRFQSSEDIIAALSAWESGGMMSASPAGVGERGAVRGQGTRDPSTHPGFRLRPSGFGGQVAGDSLVPSGVEGLRASEGRGDEQGRGMRGEGRGVSDLSPVPRPASPVPPTVSPSAEELSFARNKGMLVGAGIAAGFLIAIGLGWGIAKRLTHVPKPPAESGAADAAAPPVSPLPPPGGREGPGSGDAAGPGPETAREVPPPPGAPERPDPPPRRPPEPPEAMEGEAPGFRMLRESAVPRKASAAEQYAHADTLRVPRERIEGFYAVMHHFPDDAEHGSRAALQIMREAMAMAERGDKRMSFVARLAFQTALTRHREHIDAHPELRREFETLSRELQQKHPAPLRRPPEDRRR